MDPIICSHFKSFAQTALVASSEEAFLAGWDACRRHYDGLPAPTATTTAALAQSLYDAYPRHIGRGHAIKAIERAMIKTPVADLHRAVLGFAAAVKRWPSIDRALYVPHPATWFNRESYLDDPKEWDRGQVQVGIKVSE